MAKWQVQCNRLEVILFTGRTHQIRVHSLFMGNPVAGDDKYGQRNFNREMKKLGLKRLFLHAWKLTITHPTNGKKYALQAPLPTQLENVLTKLRQQ